MPLKYFFEDTHKSVFFGGFFWDTHKSENPYSRLHRFPTSPATFRGHPAAMTQPRSKLIPAGAPGAYHCVQRCVRRAFLCGVDRYTGQSFEHRKSWIEERIRLLAECFAVSIHAYAIMSNHLHVVLQIDPVIAADWSEDEVAARWVRIFPPRESSESAVADKCARLIANSSRLQTVRARLADLSWLMRCLAEPIARRANREDACKGRFWEGRFKVQRLCDERALLAAMAYVDLNPIRAGIADRLEESAHTSAATRIAEVSAQPRTAVVPLQPVLGIRLAPLAMSTEAYLQLLDWTGRQLHPGKRGRITADAPAVLSAVDANPFRWAARVRGIGSGYWRVVGTVHDMCAFAEAIGQRWLKGQGFAARFG